MEEPHSEPSFELEPDVVDRFFELATQLRNGHLSPDGLSRIRRFGGLVRNIRLELCLSKRELSKRSRLPIKLLRYLECGLTSPEETEVVSSQVLKALGMNPAEIIEVLSRYRPFTVPADKPGTPTDLVRNGQNRFTYPKVADLKGVYVQGMERRTILFGRLSASRVNGIAEVKRIKPYVVLI